MHMMEFVNGLVENYKDSPPIPIGSSKKWSVSQLPDFITNSIASPKLYDFEKSF